LSLRKVHAGQRVQGLSQLQFVGLPVASQAGKRLSQCPFPFLRVSSVTGLMHAIRKVDGSVASRSEKHALNAGEVVDVSMANVWGLVLRKVGDCRLEHLS